MFISNIIKMNDHSKTCNALKCTLSAEIYMQMWKVYLFCLTINKTCIILCISWLGIREGVNLQDEFRRNIWKRKINNRWAIRSNWNISYIGSYYYRWFRSWFIRYSRINNGTRGRIWYRNPRCWCWKDSNSKWRCWLYKGSRSLR